MFFAVKAPNPARCQRALRLHACEADWAEDAAAFTPAASLATFSRSAAPSFAFMCPPAAAQPPEDLRLPPRFRPIEANERNSHRTARLGYPRLQLRCVLPSQPPGRERRKA